MLITASVDFVYQSTVTPKRTKHNLFEATVTNDKCARVSLLLKLPNYKQTLSRGLSAIAEFFVLYQ